MAENEKTKVETSDKVLEKTALLPKLMPAHKSSILEEGPILKVLPDAKDLLSADSEVFGKRLAITKTDKDPKIGDLHLERLNLLRDLFKSTKDFQELREKVKERKEIISETFEENMKNIFKEQRELEITYRQLEAFFTEARLSPDDTNLETYIINASFDKNYGELMDPEKGLPSLVPKRSRFDMDGMVGLIVAPEWLKTEGRIMELGKVAMEGMSHVFTGYKDCDLKEAWADFDEGEELYNLKGTQREKQHVSLVGNHLRVRKANRYEDPEEDDGIYIDPSVILAGKVYKGDIVEGIHVAQANETHKISLVTPDNSEVKMRWPMKQKEDFRSLNTNLIPIVQRKGMVFWGVDTLYDAKGNQEEMLWEQYTVKRSDEYTGKVILDFLSGRTFSANTQPGRDQLRDSLNKWLRENTGGPDKMLQKGRVIAVESVNGNEEELDIRLEVQYKRAIRLLNLHFEYAEGDWQEKQ